MTREEAIELGKRVLSLSPFEEMREFCEIAIKALEQAPCDVSEYDKDHIWYKGGQYISLRRFLEVKAEAEKEPCEDAVSRQAVLEIIRKCHCDEWIKADIGAPIEALLSVNPAQKKGRWIMHIDDLFPVESTMECSECGEHQPITIDDNYCPKCGAQMEEVDE